MNDVVKAACGNSSNPKLITFNFGSSESKTIIVVHFLPVHGNRSPPVTLTLRWMLWDCRIWWFCRLQDSCLLLKVIRNFKPLRRSIEQSFTQSITQSVNHSPNKRINWSFSRSVSQSVDQLISRSLNQSASYSFILPENYLFNPGINQSDWDAFCH